MYIPLLFKTLNTVPNAGISCDLLNSPLQDLEDVFQYEIARLRESANPQDEEAIWYAFRWMLCSYRWLKVDELEMALAIQPDDEQPEEPYDDALADVLQEYLGFFTKLVCLDPSGNDTELRFVQGSLSEFLLSPHSGLTTPDFKEEPPPVSPSVVCGRLFKKCLAYL